MGEVAGAGKGSGGDRRGGVQPESWRVIVRAFAVAATAICLGGTVAIAALSLGAPAAISLSLMAAIVLAGTGIAGVLMYQGRRGGKAPDPETLLEWQLSARYGVRVERVAWHVWRIDGELVEATLDPKTGYLTSGGRELLL